METEQESAGRKEKFYFFTPATTEVLFMKTEIFAVKYFGVLFVYIFQCMLHLLLK